jgi:phosphoserine phosphatase
MEFVVTLVANPKKQPLTQAFVDTMVTMLAVQGITVDRTAPLAEGIACDLFLRHDNIRQLDSHVQEIIKQSSYDAIAQPVATRAKKLLIADMDSTMITIECIDELADFVGKKAEVAAITERAMNGELNFESALTERVALLKGLPESTLQQCYDERVKLMPGASELLAAMHRNHAYSVLVSGGFTFFTSRVKQALGFDEDHANRLEIAEGKLTGNVILPILGKEAKLQTLHATCAKRGITPADVLAVGDGANDLPMLLAASLGVAYHAKPIVRAQANARLNHCDLSALIYLQGYTP